MLFCRVTGLGSSGVYDWARYFQSLLGLFRGKLFITVLKVSDNVKKERDHLFRTYPKFMG